MVTVGYGLVSCTTTGTGIPCSSDALCPGSWVCRSGVCVDPGGDAGADEEARCPSAQTCGDLCCAEAEFCHLGECLTSLGNCSTDAHCSGDTYCEEGSCVPFRGAHSSDDSCEQAIAMDAIESAVQCRWAGPPDDDEYPEHDQVMATPIVVDLDLDDSAATLDPSIIFNSFRSTGHSYQDPGVLRVIDGSDCSHQLTASDPEDATMAPAPVAVGDLNGDGRAEIVSPRFEGGLVAFEYDPEAGTLERLWHSAECDGDDRTPEATGGEDKWAGASLHDLDDDGTPEVLYGGVVYDAEGCVLSSSLGYPTYNFGTTPVVADVDEDGQLELVRGDGVYAWVDGDWALEEYFTEILGDGHVAVADIMDHPLDSADGEDRAEIVVVRQGYLRVQTIEGEVVFGPRAIPGGGNGGPPTIADFDGDGKLEFATAGAQNYVVFDRDCLTGSVDPDCNGQARSDGILWRQPSQDQSSHTTGASAFDFDSDGDAEAVYADECYLRIYDGLAGDVLYSVPRASATAYDNPVVVDADGDFHTEIVVGLADYHSATNAACAAENNGVDALHPGTEYETGHGIAVYREAEERWAAARPVWNQHAYSVTNVGDRGEIFRTSLVARNWEGLGLNNFRQNVAGTLASLGIADVTANVSAIDPEVGCGGGYAPLSAKACNRGSLPVGAGIDVSFRLESVSGITLCETRTAHALDPGECEAVHCTGPLSGYENRVYAVVDPGGSHRECSESNNDEFMLLNCLATVE